ncbi:MAG: 2-iminoacetate synthase ThiH [Erysipelotrichaceae bacterium]
MNIMSKVLAAHTSINFDQFSDIDVQTALSKQVLNEHDYAALLSPIALNYLEQMAQKAKVLTSLHCGNSVSIYAPLYIANYCVNHCVYCGFNCTNKIHRAKLSLSEIEQQYKFISATGIKEILILTGESEQASSVEYIGDAVELAKKYFSTIGIEIYPLSEEGYAYLQRRGADFVSIYQETYNTKKYDEVHVSGPKKDFAFRFNAQERAIKAGMRGVGIGALLGLDDFRKDAYCAGLHALYLQREYPHADLSFSVPRLRPFINHDENNSKDVHERQLLQVMLAYRIFLPFATLSISTRENAHFRDNTIGIVANKISAGSKTSVGGYEEEPKGDAQFEIDDSRSVPEILEMLKEKNLQVVYTDYLPLQ